MDWSGGVTFLNTVVTGSLAITALGFVITSCGWARKKFLRRRARRELKIIRGWRKATPAGSLRLDVETARLRLTLSDGREQHAGRCLFGLALGAASGELRAYRIEAQAEVFACWDGRGDGTYRWMDAAQLLRSCGCPSDWL